MIVIFKFEEELYRNHGVKASFVGHPFLDIVNFPISVKELLIAYFEFDKSPLIPSREFLLFSFNKIKYIIWLKYRKLDELNNNYGFEFRTLYKCKEERDLTKFNGLSEHKLSADLSFFY